MIRLLSGFGRATVVIGALLTIAAGVIGGWGLAASDGMLQHSGGAIVGVIIGGVAGLVVAGVVFGPIATLYDIRDNIRRMAR